ncbi:hypothetical protein PCASD_12576 [Puccinia coronata f. sp. avenae]|uniref:Uncharacterized protein n=1 Tax=Puccinia coronata f. sp. avenae TaxID=200324 RepID=A0A2N5UM03_9BASI|nr:hypothetical protein PCASD_12576 [Puccinia coronata f. sp. avenae]
MREEELKCGKQRERKNFFVAIEEHQVASFSNGVPQPSKSVSHLTTATEHFAHKFEEDEVKQFDIDDGGQLGSTRVSAPWRPSAS